MSIKHILISTTEPKSVFLELLFKCFNSKQFNLKGKKITLIGNSSLIINSAKKHKYKKKFNFISNLKNAKRKIINLINIDKTKNVSSYIEENLKKCLLILKKKRDIILFNGPINKKKFLKKKYLGMTEYLANHTNSKYPVMLIYNPKISVSPITTHLPLKYVSKNIKKEKIIKQIEIINKFYKDIIKKKAKIAILGLNPHCETTDLKSEEENEIIPAIKKLKKNKIDVTGPFSADTFFLKKNITKYDVVVGMYHDQVLTPLKTLYNFDAINITLGLPFIRISPDHGPNIEMFEKNNSDPSSIFCAMKFFKKI